MGRNKKEDKDEVIEIEPAEEKIDGVLDRLQVVKVEEIKDEETEEVPYIGTPEWTSYVLSKLQPDEMYNGCPTYEGLRRICYELLGTIIDIDLTVNQSPNFQNANASCITAKMTIEHPHQFEWLGGIAGRTIRYSQVGDVFHGNGNDDKFAWRFSTATCYTRVKASLLRDAFRLRYVYAREELSDLPEEDSGVSGYCNSNQIDGLDMICQRINVDATKFMRGVWKQARKNDDTDNLNKCPFTVVAQMFALVQKFQQDPKNIPKEVLGYDKKWKEVFSCIK